MKNWILFIFGSGLSLRKISYLFYFQSLSTQHRKNEVSRITENKNEASKDLEKALQALEQAKQRVANEKKKQNEKKRKVENHHKYKPKLSVKTGTEDDSRNFYEKVILGVGLSFAKISGGEFWKTA